MGVFSHCPDLPATQPSPSPPSLQAVLTVSRNEILKGTCHLLHQKWTRCSLGAKCRFSESRGWSPPNSSTSQGRKDIFQTQQPWAWAHLLLACASHSLADTLRWVPVINWLSGSSISFLPFTSFDSWLVKEVVFHSEWTIASFFLYLVIDVQQDITTLFPQ